jgi:hypothetical protein
LRESEKINLQLNKKTKSGSDLGSDMELDAKSEESFETK